MNIFELADLDDGAARVRVARTLGLYPELRQLYDDVFIRRLIRRRRDANFLLLLLVGAEDDYANMVWSSLVADLETLEDEGAWQTFRGRLRRHERFDLESVRSEIALAAWVKRRNVRVVLEPATRNGRVCEFMAETAPATWWEMKAIHDLDFIVADEAVRVEVQGRLRRIDEPYVLTLRRSSVERRNVAGATKEIRRQIAAFHREAGTPPRTFESHGLVVEVSSMTKRPQGYVGLSTSAYCWGDQVAVRVASRIGEGAKQLPDDSAGIVVIDTTMATWVEREDVIDACFGVLSMGFFRGQEIALRGNEGAFNPKQRTRISAVVHFSRAPLSSEAAIAAIHNPFARTPLPEDVFSGKQQTRLIWNDDDTFRLETSNA